MNTIAAVALFAVSYSSWLLYRIGSAIQGVQNELYQLRKREIDYGVSDDGNET